MGNIFSLTVRVLDIVYFMQFVYFIIKTIVVTCQQQQQKS